MSEENSNPKRYTVKSLIVNDVTGEAEYANPSMQITDPFASVSAYGNLLMMPPYNFQQLVDLADAQPMHASAIEQKTVDIVADGLQFIPVDGEEETDDEERTEMMKWWESLFEEFSSVEVLQSMISDYITTGWGALEVARDINGIVKNVYYIPAHTLRAHKSSVLYAQMRSAKMVYFKRYGIEGNYYLKSGYKAPDKTNTKLLANELFVFRRPDRHSYWYGIPQYISGIGYITMAISARDFNIKFFDNYREPRHLIIISGLEGDVDETADEIANIWKTQLQGNPHSNVLLPISGEAKVTIEKMGMPINDLHFSRLMEQVDGEILVAHRMPPDRLGIQVRGFLGGSTARLVNQIYKDGVVSRGQKVVEARLKRFVQDEFNRYRGTDITTELKYKPDLEELDISDAEMDISMTVNLIKSDAITINEGRYRLAYSRLEEFDEMTWSEYIASVGGGGGMLGDQLSQAVDNMSPNQKEINNKVLQKLDDLDAMVEEVLTSEHSV